MFINFIKSFDQKPTSPILAEKLNISVDYCIDLQRKFNCYDLVSHGYDGISSKEIKLRWRYPPSAANDRSIIAPKEIDLLYLPDDFPWLAQPVGIEFNGSYWHSLQKTGDKNKAYYKSKDFFNACGGRLIHISEHLFETRPDQVYKFLDNVLLPLQPIYARNTIVKEVSVAQARSFCEENHLQGYAESRVKIGLFYQDSMVGFMGFRLNPGHQEQWENTRTSFTCRIVGGAEKMFSYFLKTYNPDSIFSLLMLQWFSLDPNNNVYARLGFKFDKMQPPQYEWIKKIPDGWDIKNRMSTQKKKLVEYGWLLKEDFDKKTEKEVMESMGYYQFYDCGKYRFTWTRDQ